MDEQDVAKGKKYFLIPLGFVAFIWAVFGLEQWLDISLSHLGVFPRSFSGLIGVVTYPLVHGDLAHITHNTWPLLILGIGLFYFYHRSAMKVSLWIWFISGLWVWSAARPSYHIGASGIIFGLASFIFVSGVLSKYYRLMALSLMVVFLYGSLIWQVFPIEEGVSYEGHLFGAIAGVILAYWYRSEAPQRKKYDWEEDDDDDIEDVEVLSEIKNEPAKRYPVEAQKDQFNYIYSKNAGDSGKS